MRCVLMANKLLVCILEHIFFFVCDEFDFDLMAQHQQFTQAHDHMESGMGGESGRSLEIIQV